MCRGFYISNRDACVIIAGCVVLSPILAVGAIGYGAYRGGAAGVRKIGDKVSDIKGHVDHQKDKIDDKKAKKTAKYALELQKQKALEALGVDYQQCIQRMFDATVTSPGFWSFYDFSMTIFMAD
eukprot:PhF_6_TR27911/c1_g3_i4/m.40981